MIQPVIFERLGLPKHSALIFTLLQDAPFLTAQIATKLSIHRPAVYRALAALTSEGFVREEKVGGRIYYASEPEMKVMDSFQKIGVDASRDIQKEESMEKLLKHTNVRAFSGKDGMRAVFDDVITHCAKGETFYRYTSERDLDKVNTYLAPDYRVRRDKKKLERLVISNVGSGSRKSKRIERFIHYLPPDPEPFNQNAIELIYGNRVALIDLNTEEAVIIENKTLAEFQKVIFRRLYYYLGS